MRLQRLRPLLPDLLAALLLVVLPLLVFWQVWTPNPKDRVMFGGDILMGAYATRVFVHQLVDAGAAPLWNPYQLGGMPLAGDVQVAPYYLPNILLDMLFRGRELTYVAFELLVVAHYALGGLFLYAYLRNLGVRAAAALIGAIGFEFNGFFVGHRGHTNMLEVVVWLPGVLWLLDLAWRAARPRRALAWAVAAGLALSQLVMAGHPQVTLYCALTIAGYAAYRWVGELRTATGWRMRLRLPALFTLAGLVAGSVAAVAWLPAAELLGRSLRSELSYDFAAQYSLLPRNLVGLLVPEFLGWSTTEYRIYAGILTLVLAAAALLVPERGRPERRFFSIAAIVALVAALGGFTVLHGLIYRFVPGFSSIRVSARAFYVANLALCVLAAFGAEGLLGPLAPAELRRLRSLARGTAALLGIATLLGATLYALLLTNNTGVSESFYFAENLFRRAPADDTFGLLTQTTNAYLLFVLLLGASVALLWLRLSERAAGRSLAGAVALLMFIDVATFAPYHDTIKADPETAHFTIKQYNTTVLKAPWQIADQQQLIDRIRQLPSGRRIDNAAEVLPDNYSAVWRAPFATGYNILDIKERYELLTAWPNLSDSARWDLLNVGHILTAADAEEPPEPGARLLIGNSQGKLWERARQPDYAHFSTGIRLAETPITLNGLLSRLDQPFDDRPAVAPRTADRAPLRELLTRLWPEALDPARYAIGTTGVVSPVDITVLAGGPIQYSAVIVDGITVTPEQRGIVLAMIDPHSGTLIAAAGYDTYLSEGESDRLAAAIRAVPDGTIVALATYDEGTAKLNDEARAALASIGATADLRNAGSVAYALVGVKGAAAGSAMEALDPQRAVTLDVGIGAFAPPPEAHVTSKLLAYEPDRISLLVQNNVRGLLMVSEAVFPGWEAYVDGLPTPILRANGLLRAVILPPALDGQPHEVTFVYRPMSVRLGTAISTLGLALASGLLLACGVPAGRSLLGRAVRPRGIREAPRGA